MTAYYNEHDKAAVKWLKGLIERGHIAEGVVDERSITEVQSDDLVGFTQCHFFAGIGGWSYALRLASWSDQQPVWTGSCPCQPFSTAGKGKGKEDERHLWPELHRLICECRPPVCFGEQVAGKAGESWLDDVAADLEGTDYAFGAVTFPACSVGAPHQRQRLYWVADAQGKRQCADKPGGDCRHREQLARPGERSNRVNNGTTSSVAHTSPTGLQRREQAQLPGAVTVQEGGATAQCSPSSIGQTEPGPTNSLWADADWLWCRDERWRPVEPGTFPLADGIPARMGRLRGYGNAIVPQQAQQFIQSYMELS